MGWIPVIYGMSFGKGLLTMDSDCQEKSAFMIVWLGNEGRFSELGVFTSLFAALLAI